MTVGDDGSEPSGNLDGQRDRGASGRAPAAVTHPRVQPPDVVAELQQALLPAALPVLPGLSIAARYLVAAHDQAAGGDWFDVIPLPDGAVALVVGDVVGHGVAASAAMGQLRAVLGELLLETGDVQAALHRIDRMATRSPALRATTVCVAVLDAASGALQYCTCGHPPPLVIGRIGAPRVLTVSGAGPLGTGATLPLATAQLDPGEVVLLYSDGLIERAGQSHEIGLAALARAAVEALQVDGPGSDTERVCARTVELLTREGYADDLTVLATQRVAVVDAFRHELSTADTGLVALQEEFGAWVDRVGPAADDQRALRLALTELVANALEHAYADAGPGPVRVAAELGRDGVVTVEVADEGRWREPGPPPDTRGRGLWMAGAVVDELRLIHGPARSARAPRRPRPAGGTVARVRKRLHRPATLGSLGPGSSGCGAPADFSARVEDGPQRLLRVTGPLDITTAPRFADRLDSASRGGVFPLVVDLSEVEVLASAGVRALFAARDRHAAYGRPLTLVAVGGSAAAQVLDLVGLGRAEADVNRAIPPGSGHV